MKITRTNESERKTISFSEVPVGKVFKTDNNGYFLKIVRNWDSPLNALTLIPVDDENEIGSMILTQFSSDFKVIYPIDAHLEIDD